MRFCTVAKAKVSLCKCADSPEPSLLAQNGIQSPFVTKAQTRQSKFRLMGVCTFAQARLSLRNSTRIPCAGSDGDLCTVYVNSEC